jgi:hypothetical protein
VVSHRGAARISDFKFEISNLNRDNPPPLRRGRDLEVHRRAGHRQGCREVKRVNVSAAFFLSIEFQQAGYFVYLVLVQLQNPAPNT